jgi:hypothetical protein
MHETAIYPYIAHIRRYGCVAYVYIKKEYRQQRDKMGKRAWKGQLIGYDGLHGKIY